MKFRDRKEAGHLLAEKLEHYRNRPDVTILALPRGGVPVAYEVARELEVPLDLFVVRKLGVPGREELAMGAIASGGARVINEEVVRFLHIPQETIEAVAARELRELDRRERVYRGDRTLLPLRGRTAILIDDGLATGSTMLAAVKALRKQEPARIVVAIPVAAEETCGRIAQEVDEVICVRTPPDFTAVSLWYEQFAQTSDQEVRMLYESGSLGQHSPSL